jgi:putative ABC transport system substrate-binding protein
LSATGTVPIVIFGPDALGFGFAASLAHPGGNVTGVVILTAELDGKRVERLHEIVPAAKRLAALLVPPSPGSEREMLAVASNAGIELRVYPVTGPGEYAASFAKMRAAWSARNAGAAGGNSCDWLSQQHFAGGK